MLTVCQRNCLRFIASEILRTGGVAPSRSEIAAHLGLRSKSGVRRIIDGLEERGFLRVLPNRARAMEVLRPPMVVERWFVFDDDSQALVPLTKKAKAA